MHFLYKQPSQLGVVDSNKIQNLNISFFLINFRPFVTQEHKRFTVNETDCGFNSHSRK